MRALWITVTSILLPDFVFFAFVLTSARRPKREVLEELVQDSNTRMKNSTTKFDSAVDCMMELMKQWKENGT